MKKMNKKGFTLIELLAVIVILAIIMVIAVPQILDVIDNSRKQAWDSNVKLIDEAITLNMAIAENKFSTFSLSTSCTSTTEGSPSTITEAISKIADISADDTEVTCYSSGGKYKVKIAPKGQFAKPSITAVEKEY